MPSSTFNKNHQTEYQWKVNDGREEQLPRGSDLIYEGPVPLQNIRRLQLSTEAANKIDQAGLSEDRLASELAAAKVRSGITVCQAIKRPFRSP